MTRDLEPRPGATLTQPPAHYQAPWRLRLASWVQKLLAPAAFRAGSDFAANAPTRAGYDPAAAMSAFVAFPWVYASINALCDDLQRVPVKLYRKGRDGVLTEVPAHPVLDLLTQPASKTSGTMYRQQRIADRVLTGNHYAVMLGTGRQPVSLMRLHPKRVEVVPQPDGQVGSYKHEGQAFAADEVVHTRGVSWQDNGRGLFGAGAIEALHNYLTADQNLWKRSAESAKQGRPDAIVSPQDGDLGKWEKAQARAISEELQRIFRDAHGGTAVIGHALKLDTLTWSAKDLQHIEVSAAIRDAVLGVIGVPGARLGLTDGVNYANADAQIRSYWQSRIMPLRAEFDEADTQVARQWDTSLVVRGDFGQIPELQEDATARLARVRMWFDMGYTPQQAAEIEGMSGLPEPKRKMPVAGAVPAAGGDNEADEDEGADDEQDEAAKIADGLWRKDSPAAAPSGAPSDTSRKALWQSKIDKLHKPAEDELSAQFALWQDEVLADVLAVIERESGLIGRSPQIPAMEKNAIRDLLVSLMLLDGWSERLVELMMPSMLSTQRAVFEDAAASLGVEFEWTTEREATAAHQALNSQLIVKVPQTTRDAVALVVNNGLEGGLTVNELQADIRAMSAFSPQRALAVARTETTRLTTSGTEQAIRDAQEEMGDEARVVKEWLSGHDSATRRTHRELDGVKVGASELFEMSSGARGRGPGDMGRPEEDINCRCLLVPGVEEL